MDDNNDLTLKLAKILNLAENASTSEEAEAYMAKAQELSIRFSIDLEIARQAQQDRSKRADPVQRNIRIISENNGRRETNSHEIIELFSTVAHHNDVQFNILGRHTMICFGFVSDIDFVETLFNSLRVQMVRQANTKIARKDTDGVHGKRFRTSFYAGFDQKICSRLAEVRHSVIAETSGAELVVRNKSLEVQDFYSLNSRAKGHYRGAQRYLVGSAFDAGKIAAERASLGQATLEGRKQIA